MSKVKLLSRVRLFATPWTVPYQAPPSMGFSRQEFWSGLPFPSSGIFPTQGSNPGLLHCSQIRYYLSHQRGPPAGGQSEKCTYLSILLLSDFLLETLLEELKEKLENMVTGWCYLHRLASTDPEKSVECVEMKSKGKIKNIPSQ